ncbi:hypothetical protein [Desulfosarcina ovata]|uniref:Uncharacterized protein n=1 Tax=Desulfosarcina ovata subsp. ovata TaxID=2752305 RepID=A0A5K8A873_9BACT|nr:hypothetical protein [Desulfosarcina ovata]BBO88737.1 hypothetical protein DSCOOX_19170 [Desulfosarcina ovata subsp. ovata]
MGDDILYEFVFAGTMLVMQMRHTMAGIGPIGRLPSVIAFKIMFLGCVIGRRCITIQLPPSGLTKNIILNTIEIRLNGDFL